MARPRKIDPDQAVPRAMSLFWRHGFHEVGTRQIEAETGVTRFALQAIHGGKLALYLQSLDLYLDRLEGELLPRMDDGTLAGLAGWLEQIGSVELTGPNAGCGCMAVNALVEFAGQEPEVHQRVQRFRASLRGALRRTLARIAAAGGLAAGVDLEAATDLLVAAVIGINVANRTVAGPPGIPPLARGVAAIVRGWAA